MRAMNRAAQAGQNVDPEQARRAIEQARRQLREALEQLTEQRQAAAEDAFSDLAERSSDVYAEQRRLAQELQQALNDALDDQVDRNARRGGLPRDVAEELSERKYALRDELEALEEDIQGVAQQFDRETPGASDALSEALSELQQMQAVARLGYGAEGIRYGAAQQVAATDAITTSALRDLERSTQEALERARVEAVAGEDAEIDPNAELVAEIQSLRRALADMAAGDAGQQPGGEQQGGRQAGGQQQGGQQAGGQQQGGQQAGGNQFGGQFGGGGDRFGFRGGRGFYDPNRTAAWDLLNSPVWNDPEAVQALRDRLEEAGRELLTTSTRLRAEGISDEELERVRQLGEQLRRGLTGNPELVAREFQQLVNLAEQLELSLREEGNAADTAVRTEAPIRFAPGYEEEVAEYFRRLSESGN
jgi:exonuclease VII large subunit